MSFWDKRINNFYMQHNVFRKPLEKIVNKMLRHCEYLTGESLERHNWGGMPLKLNRLPGSLENSTKFETELLDALNLPENDKSIIELLWGDIQLGKRVHALIIMWISIYIFKRPVLYIFRNLEIDQRQLKHDIDGDKSGDFNIKFIKSCFDEFSLELQDIFDCDASEANKKYTEFILPEMKIIDNKNLSNLEALGRSTKNSNNIYSCLMNIRQLSKVDAQFTKYVINNQTLVDMTVLVDESDLMSPTSSNDKSHKNDLSDTAECEKIFAKIYKKVRYVCHITGTAHSLLYNITTRLSQFQDIQLKISKVHKMKRTNNYYGLFNRGITFKSVVNPWWQIVNPATGNKPKYDIIRDYTENIKGIITEIYARKETNKLQPFNSFLISEEKFKKNHFLLAEQILRDFPLVFVIVYHGNCLRLYLNKCYLDELKEFSINKMVDEERNTGLRDVGGIYVKPNNAHSPNIIYYDIDPKKYTIKKIYKLLRVLFVNSKCDINKFVITITGKYGERGYSFTSDNYGKYLMHLTDQYLVSHSTFNCTDMSQRLRLQGKYETPELVNGTMKLNLWTTSDFKDVMENFYVKFIKEIEQGIMNCNRWEDIKKLLENIIDNGDLNFRKYLKYLDAGKKLKSIKVINYYDKQIQAYALFNYENMTDDEIRKWIAEHQFPVYTCINKIDTVSVAEFMTKYGVNNYVLDDNFYDFTSNADLDEFKKQNNVRGVIPKQNSAGFYLSSTTGKKTIFKYDELKPEVESYKGTTNNLDIKTDAKIGKQYSRLYISYKDTSNPASVVFTQRVAQIKNIIKQLPEQTKQMIMFVVFHINNLAKMFVSQSETLMSQHWNYLINIILRVLMEFYICVIQPGQIVED